MIEGLTAFLVVALAGVAFYLRRNTHRQEALQQQWVALRQELGAERDSTRQRDAGLQASLATTVARGDLVPLQERLDRLQTAYQDLHAVELQRASQLAASLDGLDSRLAGFGGGLAELGRHVATLTSEVRAGLPQDSPSPEIVQSLAGKSTEELLAAASALAVLRPLVPYPAWRFDADLRHPDLAFQTRRAIWQCLHDRGHASLVAGWHGATRINLDIGNDSSRQIFIAGCLDPNELAFLDRLLEPGMTIVDAGANEGLYTLFAVRKVGPSGSVWAFEPSSREMARLRENLALNALDARLFPCALADRAGEADLKVAELDHAGQNTLGAFAYPSVAADRAERVPVERLDDIVAREGLDRLDFLKADVEGAELRLFRGAENTLRRFRPVLLFEVSELSLHHQGASRDELLGYLASLGYQSWIFDTHTGLPIEAPAGTFAENMIAVPRERGMNPRWQQYWPA